MKRRQCLRVKCVCVYVFCATEATHYICSCVDCCLLLVLAKWLVGFGTYSSQASTAGWMRGVDCLDALLLTNGLGRNEDGEEAT